MREAHTAAVVADQTSALPHVSAREAGGPRASATPERIGGYRICGELGQGGMGVVYLAAREGDGDHRVALKVLRPGVDTDEVVRRFELERQLLAALDHPGIARIHDAGETGDGLPFYVMEYIDGVPIDRHCDEHRLSIDDRLRLFEKVCAAVQRAHQNLIVHRDLKPGNILVTRDGQPKLLDFGIAKIINPAFSPIDEDPTVPGCRVMTPDYASPEQIRGLTLTTASDVYSLGVILYELLSGHRPYRFDSRRLADMERAICTEDPERPSTALTRLDQEASTDFGPTTSTAEAVSRARGGRPSRIRRRLSGDLDNIVVKAMRKEPQRRYRSAAHLAEDIRRHLDGHPVSARPDTLTYRARKFVKRHRGGVLASSFVLAATLAATAAAAWSWAEADRSRGASEQARVAALAAAHQTEQAADRARERFSQVRDLANAFIGPFHDAIVELDGALPARRMLVERGLSYLDALTTEAAGDLDLKRELARGYMRIGDIRGGVRSESFGDSASALESYRRALALRREVAAATPGDEDLRHEVAASHLKIAERLEESGDVAGALEHAEAALAIQEAVAADDPMGTAARRNLAVALSHVGEALLANGRAEDAMPVYERSLGIRAELAAENPLAAGNPESLLRQRELATMLLRVGARHAHLGNWAQTVELYRHALDIRERVLEASPASGRYRRDVAMTRLLLGGALVEHRDHAAAETPFRLCLESFTERAAANPESVRAQRDLAIAHLSLAQWHGEVGAWTEAQPHIDALHEIMTKLCAVDATSTYDQRLLAASHELLGEATGAEGDLGGAAGQLERAVGIMSTLVAGDPPDARPDPDLSRMLTRQGAWLRRAGDGTKARNALSRARGYFDELHAHAPLDPIILRGRAETLIEQARDAADRNDGARSLALAREAVETAPFPTPQMRRDLAYALHLTGDDAGAREEALRALRELDETSSAGKTLRRRLGEDLRTYGHPAEDDDR